MNEPRDRAATRSPVSERFGDRPVCADECRAVLVAHWRRFGIEANISWTPPLVDSGYEKLRLTCPHGVKWYGEPTTEQIAVWVRDGVE